MQGAGRGQRPGPALVIASVLIGTLFVAPLAFIVIQNVRLDVDVATIWTNGAAGPLGRSLLLATAVALTTAVIGTGLAWCVQRTDTVGNRLWAVLAPLPLVFPSFVGATAMITGFARGGLLERLLTPLGVGRLPELSGFFGAWLVLSLFTYPYVYLPVAARLRRLSASAEDAAVMLGKSTSFVFFTIVVPQLWSAISAGMLLTFLYTISDFGAVQLLRYDTLTRAIYSNGIASPATFYAMALLVAAVALAVVGLERRQSRFDAPLSARARPPRRRTLGRWRWATAGLLACLFTLGIAGPAASLGYWVVRGVRSTRTSGATALDGEGLASAALNTVFVGVAAALITVALVVPIAYMLNRYRSRVGEVTNAFVVAGFGLPGIVIALALVYWTLRSPLVNGLYQTLPLLVLSYVIHFGSQATRATTSAMGAVAPGVDDAARLLGASRLRRMLTINLPLTLPGLAAAVGLVLLSTMKELPSTLFLRPTGFDTLATRIWGSMESVAYARAGLDSLVLLAVSAVLTWLLVIRSAARIN